MLVSCPGYRKSHWLCFKRHVSFPVSTVWALMAWSPMAEEFEKRSPESWSTCSSIFCGDKGHGYAIGLSPQQPCRLECVHRQWSDLPHEILQSSYAQCYNVGSQPCDVAVVQSHPHIAGHTSCRLLDEQYWRTYNVQEAANFILDFWPVMWLVNSSMAVNIGHILQPAAPHWLLPGIS